MTKMGISNATDLSKSNIFKWYEIFRSWLYYREGNATYYKQGRADRSLFLMPLGKFRWKNVKTLLITDHKAFTRQVKPDDKAVISKMKCKLSRTISL